MDKCPRCRTEMNIEQDAYVRGDVIVLHEVERCPECGEIMLTEEQMGAFVEKLHGAPYLLSQSFLLIDSIYN
jgi:YgiT-type zinc finger domain